MESGRHWQIVSLESVLLCHGICVASIDYYGTGWQLCFDTSTETQSRYAIPRLRDCDTT